MNSNPLPLCIPHPAGVKKSSGTTIVLMIVTVEVRVLHQVKFVDRIDLLTGDRGRGGRGRASDVSVMVMVVMVVVHVLVMGPVVVLDGQVQGHGVRTDLVRRRGAAVHRHVRTAETVDRMVSGVRTC